MVAELDVDEVLAFGVIALRRNRGQARGAVGLQRGRAQRLGIAVPEEPDVSRFAAVRVQQLAVVGLAGGSRCSGRGIVRFIQNQPRTGDT